MQRRRVLIVDNDPDAILITKRALLEANYEIAVEAVSSGEAALAFLRNERELPALVLLDLKMPGMGGLDVLRRIRTDTRLKNLTVVVFSSSSLESDEKESLACGANAFIHKATNIDQIRRDIRSLLEFLA
jgi:two-component system response regulator